MTERINIPYNRKGDPDVHHIVIPAGYISLEDLLSHLGYQLGIPGQLEVELSAVLAAEHSAGRREMAEQIQAVSTGHVTYNPDFEAQLRIVNAELTGYTNGR